MSRSASRRRKRRARRSRIRHPKAAPRAAFSLSSHWKGYPLRPADSLLPSLRGGVGGGGPRVPLSRCAEKLAPDNRQPAARASEASTSGKTSNALPTQFSARGPPPPTPPRKGELTVIAARSHLHLQNLHAPPLRGCVSTAPAASSDPQSQTATRDKLRPSIHTLATHSAPELWPKSRPLQVEGWRAQGRPGAGRARGPPANKMQAAGTTGLAEHTRPSPRDGFNGL